MDGKYFKLSEIIQNRTTNSIYVENAENLITLLDKIREEYGKPIIISGGFRTKEQNEACGGSPNSQHLTGQAVDLQPGSTDGDRMENLRKIFKAAWRVAGYDQLIWEHPKGTRGWVHVSLVNKKWKENHPAKANRHQTFTYYGGGYNTVTNPENVHLI